MTSRTMRSVTTPRTSCVASFSRIRWEFGRGRSKPNRNTFESRTALVGILGLPDLLPAGWRTSRDLDRPRRIPSRRGGNRGDNRRECKWCGSLYVGTLSLSNPVDSEDVSSRRFAAAGAVLVGGLLFGLVLSSLFRWSPYYWQWLAYHNGLVAAVITYLLTSATDDAPRRRALSPIAAVR